MNKTMKRIFVCSPLRGDLEGNQKKAETYCKYVSDLGHAPYAPHLFFTRFLDDNIEEERNAGINGGIEFLKVCDELWVFGHKITGGMEKEIKYCIESGIIVKFISSISLVGIPVRD